MAKPWQIMALPEVDLTNEDIAKAIQIQAVEVKKTIDIATATLTRKRQGWLREALAREGHTAATLRDQAMRCIFGFSSNNDVEGCSEVARFVCDDCEAICCEFHQAHSRHKEYVSDTAILRQQQALSQQKIGEAPAKETSQDTELADKKEDKAPRKNTWADLEQRYKALKGEDYVRPPGQKKTDFQLMVEGLEGRERRDAPAVAEPKGPPAPTIASAVPDSIDNLFQQYFRDQFQEFLRGQNTSLGNAAANFDPLNTSINNTNANNDPPSSDDDHE